MLDIPDAMMAKMMKQLDRANLGGTEKQLHTAVIGYLNAALPRSVRAFTVPNAGAMGQAGLTKGVPDICLVKAGGSVAFIELKTAKGKLSSAQAEWLNWCVSNGIEASVCRSIDDVKAMLKAWGVKTREAT